MGRATMIVDVEGSEQYVWVDGPLPPDFERRLLTELVALARPEGFGYFEAAAWKCVAGVSVLDGALQQAAFNQHGRRNVDDAYRFDYVSGYRIKVAYLPFGFSVYDDSPEIHMRHPGLPAVVSSEFDAMYGAGALEGAVRLALQ